MIRNGSTKSWITRSCAAFQRPSTADIVVFWLKLSSMEIDHKEGSWIASVQTDEPDRHFYGGCSRCCPAGSELKDGGRRSTSLLTVLVLPCNPGLTIPKGNRSDDALEFYHRNFTNEITNLTPKSTNTADPTNYRPISYLIFINKTLTSVLSY